MGFYPSCPQFSSSLVQSLWFKRRRKVKDAKTVFSELNLIFSKLNLNLAKVDLNELRLGLIRLSLERCRLLPGKEEVLAAYRPLYGLWTIGTVPYQKGGV
jgi:hypothetical protein